MDISSSSINEKKSNEKKLFKNPLLEKLTHTHAAVPISMYLIFGAGLLVYELYYQLVSVGLTILLFTVGLLLFTLVEYVMHRFVFHMSPTTPLKKDITHKFHGVHHHHPKDKSRLAMPPIVSVVLASSFFYLFYLALNDYCYPFTAGFLTGYALYLGVHYMIHAMHPPKNFLKILWIHHSIHHYRDDTKAFGVSSPLWDFVFRTMPD
ncbi:sterol desaturase family protein [Flammeovirga sp. EKP202]|uniref:sterol desaturase family protein n=1 Tax=Flammeovirga sp. EKP202 TaxID=2770592 RepID=UPI00165F0AF5|nr:sterol desaturase family protein [Flammeovirga sp. EKP202]MBD0400978.1 sterol desaturase family protein [Flammeovirga sp. EKP202]